MWYLQCYELITSYSQYVSCAFFLINTFWQPLTSNIVNYNKTSIMRHLGSKCHINDYVTPRYYHIFLVSQRCHIKEVRLYSYIYLFTIFYFDQMKHFTCTAAFRGVFHTQYPRARTKHSHARCPMVKTLKLAIYLFLEFWFRNWFQNIILI
jgi:hypothetical protein